MGLFSALFGRHKGASADSDDKKWRVCRSCCGSGSFSETERCRVTCTVCKGRGGEYDADEKWQSCSACFGNGQTIEIYHNTVRCSECKGCGGWYE